MEFKETETTELKRILNDSFEKALVAFLNSMDGTIYVGVDDKGEVLGIENLDKTQKEIADIITTRILPNPQELVDLGSVYVDGKNVIKVNVRKGNALYYIKQYGRSAQGCYVRIGTSCRSMTEEQIESEFVRHIAIPQITLVTETSPRQDLTFRIFKIYLEAKDVNYTTETFNDNFKLLNGNKKYNYLAFVLSDQFDLSVKVAKFNGKDKQGEFIYRKEFGYCSLLKAMDDVLSFVESTVNTVRSYFEGKAQRRDEFLIDKDSFREAWINACLHNDYSTHLAPAVFIYTDHIEIFSYGNALKLLTKEKFLKGVSNPINPELAKIFMRLDYVEESGKGINTIVRKYGESVFEFSDNFLQVNLPYNKLVVADDDTLPNKLPDKLPNKLTKTQNGIVKIIKQTPSTTIEDMAKTLSVGERTVRYNLAKLTKLGIIRRVGSRKSGYWEIVTEQK